MTKEKRLTLADTERHSSAPGSICLRLFKWTRAKIDSSNHRESPQFSIMLRSHKKRD